MSKPPAAVAAALEGAADETLQATIAYCETQLESDDVDDEPEASEPDPPDEWEADEEAWEAAVEDVDAPARATTTTKEIKENQYVYLQWSEDGTTKSEYVAPVNPKR